MKYLALFILLVFANINLNAQVVGLWKNVDDEDGKDKSHIEIYESNGTLKAKVIKLLPAATLKVCDKCKDSKKGKPIEGMEIAWDLKKDTDKSYINGKILDPKTGKIYDCDITLVDKSKLKVRGYMGISVLGRTQYWYKVN